MIENDVQRKQKAVAIWLLVGVFMIMIQVVLGGIVRLTDSGLSMTEWKPILGFLPPLNQADWQKAFEGYQQIAQYKYVNNSFTLADFKFIYFWEWFHRLWARSLGVVFAIPFIYFLIKKYFSKKMIVPLLILFGLGGLQGFIGWYMVKSGLGNSDLLRVSHIRLAIHFIAALILLCYTLWFALKLLVPSSKIVIQSRLQWFFIGILSLLTVQLIYGAFMAGLRAAPAAPTWPKINASWIPQNFIENSWIDDPLNVQFIHRTLAYILVILIVIGCYKLIRLSRQASSSLLKKAGSIPIVLVLIQVVLGIISLLLSPHIAKGKFGGYEIFAQSHQLVGMCLLMSIVFVLYLVRGKHSSTVNE